MSKLESEDKDLGVKLTTACEVTEHRLAIVWNAIDAIDTKTNIILGFASVILVVLVGFFSLEPSKWRVPSLVVFSAALLAYVILVVMSIMSYRTKEWSYRPEPGTLIEHCQNNNYSADDIRTWVVNETKSACYHDLEMLKKKSRLTNMVLYVFAAETVLVVFGLAYTLVIQ